MKSSNSSTEKPQENKDMSPPAYSEPCIIDYTPEMTFEDFVEACKGKDVNHCYFNGRHLAFHLTMMMEEGWDLCDGDGPNEYFKFMMYMLENGLNPNIHFRGDSLLKITNGGLRRALTNYRSNNEFPIWNSSKLLYEFSVRHKAY